eukprot:scaffold206621_cov18-Tisochrysis_lutea.AAC.1
MPTEWAGSWNERLKLLVKARGIAHFKGQGLSVRISDCRQLHHGHCRCLRETQTSRCRRV